MTFPLQLNGNFRATLVSDVVSLFCLMESKYRQQDCIITKGGLFYQNKLPVKFMGPNLFYTWLLIFCYRRVVLVFFTSSTSQPYFLCRSSRSQMFFKIGIPKNFADFTAKHLCWNLFLIMLQAFRSSVLLKSDSNKGVFL